MPLPLSFSPFPHPSRLTPTISASVSSFISPFHEEKTLNRLLSDELELFTVDRDINRPLMVCLLFLFLTADRTASSFLCYPIVAEGWLYAQVTGVSRTVGNSPSGTLTNVTHGISYMISDIMKYNCLSKVVCLVIGIAGGCK